VPLLGAGCCLFLMFYLPPASWWRFVGWLVLGASIYAFFGWRNSRLGRRQGRPEVNPLFMNLLGAGFLLAGVGLFVIPHDAAPGELLRLALSDTELGHARAQLGGGLIAAGLAAIAVGAAVGSRGRRTRGAG
jgi:APA family basic amino acid/polyamine antiporter